MILGKTRRGVRLARFADCRLRTIGITMTMNANGMTHIAPNKATGKPSLKSPVFADSIMTKGSTITELMIAAVFRLAVVSARVC